MCIIIETPNELKNDVILAIVDRYNSSFDITQKLVQVY